MFRIPVEREERDNYTHYVKITAVNSLGQAGQQSKLHSFVVRQRSHYRETTPGQENMPLPVSSSLPLLLPASKYNIGLFTRNSATLINQKSSLVLSRVLQLTYKYFLMLFLVIFL